VVIIVAYIVAAQLFLVIGKQGIINPVIAGLAPTLAFIAYGIDRVVRNQA
jgi:lipopolysaccharide export LptBFGC system permease protein LptF